MAEQYQPEVGQALFGNPRRDWAVPEWIVALLERLADEIWRVTWNNSQEKGLKPTNDEGSEYVNNTFEMRSYYWGECTCGWADVKSYDEPHDAGCYQIELALQQEDLTRSRHEIYTALTQKYGLPMFGCAVHCTCSHTEREAAWFEQNKLGPHGHAEDCGVGKPNFKCGDFEVCWYKHSRRGTSMNREIEPAEAVAIFEWCFDSVRREEMMLWRVLWEAGR